MRYTGRATVDHHRLEWHRPPYGRLRWLLQLEVLLLLPLRDRIRLALRVSELGEAAEGVAGRGLGCLQTETAYLLAMGPNTPSAPVAMELRDEMGTRKFDPRRLCRLQLASRLDQGWAQCSSLGKQSPIISGHLGVPSASRCDRPLDFRSSRVQIQMRSVRFLMIIYISRYHLI